MATHPSHGVSVRDDHKAKWERWEMEKRKKDKVKLELATVLDVYQVQ